MSKQTSIVPPHFLVFIPGIMGSKLQDKKNGKLAWLDFSSIPLNPLAWDGWLEDLLNTVAYPNEDLEPAGILDEVLFVPPWVKQEEYSRFTSSLSKLGYSIDPSEARSDRTSLYTFAYDWRQDNRVSARQLGAAITEWRSLYPPETKAWIIAHSMGGLVARWYIEKEGGKDHVERLLLLASPRDGAPQAMRLLYGGLNTLFRRVFNLLNIGERTRNLIRTFPSIYQLLPYENPFLRDMNNEVVHLYENPFWLGDNDRQKGLLLDGRQFNRELGTTLSVDTLCFFGRKKPTVSSGIVRFGAGGAWNSIDWSADEVGDGTVPERSALHPEAREKLPFIATHGDIYVHRPLEIFLEWELVDKYRAGVRSTLVSERFTIIFNPGQDIYSPGSDVELEARVYKNPESVADKQGAAGSGNSSSLPFPGASIRVQMFWHQPLPGTQQAVTPTVIPSVVLSQETQHPGVYKGKLVAPQIEGYYRLVATIRAQSERTLILEELIAVEAPLDVAVGPAPAKGDSEGVG